MKLNDVAAYVVYGALVMSTGMGLAAATEVYQSSQQVKPLCLGEVSPRPTTATQDIAEIDALVQMKK